MPCALDGAGEAALIGRGQTGVFARKDATLIGNIFTKQLDVFRIEVNEVEIHPGYYVDWDETPDETLGPLAQAYGEYITQILSEREQ